MKKSLGILVRSGIWVSTAALLLLCLLAARLLFAPIDLGFARDRLEAGGESFLPGWQINFTNPEIGWDWRGVRPWISIQDLRLVDRRNRMAVYIPGAHVGVSFSSLWGDISVSTIELNAAQILVTDLAGFSDATSGSSFADLFGSGGVPKPEVFRPVSEAFSRFGARLMRQAPALDTIKITSAMVEIARGGEFANARLALPRMELSREGDLLLLDALTDIQLGNRPTQLRLSGQAEPFVGELEVSLGFSEFRPRDLELQAEMPEFASYLDFPVTVALDLSLAANVGLRAASFDLQIDDGFISHPVRFPERAPIRFGSISGKYEPAEDMITISSLLVQAGENEITGLGKVQWTPGFDQPSISLLVQAETATIDDVKRYWPIATDENGEPRGARQWVDENMISGGVRNVEFRVEWSPESGGAFDKGSAYKLTFGVRDVDTRYLREMPPIEGAYGNATLTREDFTVLLNQGTVLGMPIGGSTAAMSDIHLRGQGEGVFDIKLNGPVGKIMEVLSHDPLNVPERLNFDMARLDGEAQVRAVVTVPLVKNAPKEDVRYDVQAKLQDVSVNELLGGEGLREGDLTLTLDGDRLSLEGDGALNGVPVNLYWRENFAAGREDEVADTTEVVISGEMDEGDIAAFGVDISGFLDGKVFGDATFIGRNFAFRRGYFSADATGAIIKAPQLAWKKEADAPATITGTLVFSEQGTALAPLTVTGEEIDLTAQFNWPSKGSEGFDGDFTIRQMGRHSLAGTVVQTKENRTEVKIIAKTFDAGAFLADLDDAATDTRQDIKSTSSGTTDISLDAERLLLLNGESFGNVRLTTHFEDEEPKNLAFNGVVWGTEKPVTLSISEGGAGTKGQVIQIASPDGGQFLRGLGLFAHLRDGALELNGTTSGWGNRFQLGGRAKIDDSLLVAKKNLGPSVEEGTIAGLEDFLSDGPVELEEVDMPFTYVDGLLDLPDLKANGPTMGMTMKGQISAREDKINVNGVFVPAYGINSLLGKIPLLGTLLTGGDGKGVFGVTYRVKGQLEAPEFSVNPVSGLAPGFLRLLFEGGKGKISDVKSPEKPEATPEEPAETRQGPTQDNGEQPPKAAEDDDKPKRH
ncbi:MAG: AsmA-like C-terminal domain-containing protein [Alphaproteobacteria bacterium]|nr:AsmA-like C-terminal domain-containing protein [Alphaproteobacteria bacterium]